MKNNKELLNVYVSTKPGAVHLVVRRPAGRNRKPGYERRHSRLGYRSPAAYEHDYDERSDCATGTDEVECPRFRGHLSAGSALSDLAGRMGHHAKGIEFQEAVPAGVPA